ncbi:hypothetical protein NL676_014761 [Syzygium grande]|nr:hypothetical protein NL676_014761 [Syzygium grande]
MTRLMFLKQGEEAKNAEVARLAGNGDDIGKAEKDENDAEEEDVLEEDQFDLNRVAPPAFPFSIAPTPAFLWLTVRHRAFGFPGTPKRAKLLPLRTRVSQARVCATWAVFAELGRLASPRPAHLVAL